MKVVLIFLLTLVILAGAQISLARPQYLTSLSTLYDNVSCSTCHVNGNSDGPRLLTEHYLRTSRVTKTTPLQL
jgi:hypothetical protein